MFIFTSPNPDYLVHSMQVGIVRVKWDPSGSSNIFTAGLDGCVRLWDGRSGQMVNSWVGHRGEILDMAITRYECLCI